VYGEEAAKLLQDDGPGGGLATIELLERKEHKEGISSLYRLRWYTTPWHKLFPLHNLSRFWSARSFLSSHSHSSWYKSAGHSTSNGRLKSSQISYVGILRRLSLRTIYRKGSTLRCQPASRFQLKIGGTPNHRIDFCGRNMRRGEDTSVRALL
jgi:hypothetical protein